MQTPTFDAAFYRSYSRLTGNNKREHWQDVVERVVTGLSNIGKFTKEESQLLKDAMMELKATASGRALWYAGTENSENPDNYYGLYNCVSITVESFEDLCRLFYLQCLGCGVGAVLEQVQVDKLPKIENFIDLDITGEIGEKDKEERLEDTVVECPEENTVIIHVGDSKQGWVKAYKQILNLSVDCNYTCQNGIDRCGNIKVDLDVSNIRPKGEKLYGFGGTANPIKFKSCFEKVVNTLNKAAAGNRKLTQLETTLIIDEPSKLIVAGGIRRSAGMRQYDYNSPLYKMGLWKPGEDGVWRIDPEKDALRMANHTLNYHSVPEYTTIEDSVRNQFYSGEGAIAYVPEILARANADLLINDELKYEFQDEYEKGNGYKYLLSLDPEMTDDEVNHRLTRYGLNPCSEIIGRDFLCNLSEVFLNNLDPADLDSQKDAFQAATLSVCALLHQDFNDPKMQRSREYDPIIGVSFTGLFDFFVEAIGLDYVHWNQEGRPMDEDDRGVNYAEIEKQYLQLWYRWVEDTVYSYCLKHNLKVPNRFTCVKPSGTLSLLTGASPGWHSPKASHMIRRITFQKEDPIALAYNALGYNITPAHGDTDENGSLLEDPWDSRCTEWLVEIPVSTTWGYKEGSDKVDLGKIPATSQMEIWSQVQKYWTGHNTSATIELRENEIADLAEYIYNNIKEGQYTSVAILSRFDDFQSFPRLPFEPISKEKYEELLKQQEDNKIFEDFYEALEYFDESFLDSSQIQGPAPCDSDKCMLS